MLSAGQKWVFIESQNLVLFSSSMYAYTDFSLKFITFMYLSKVDDAPRDFS